MPAYYFVLGLCVSTVLGLTVLKNTWPRVIECPALSSGQLWDILLHQHCVPLANTGGYPLQWPYDVDQPKKYSCGYGPAGPVPDGAVEWLPVVHIMNATTFLQTVHQNRSGSASDGTDWCLIVNFYAPYCPFSARLAPFYNALPRVFPRLYVVAVDATEFSRLNSRYGIAGTPTILLWHNGKAVSRFEDADYALSRLAKFVTQYTDLEPTHTHGDVEDEDMLGPLPCKPTTATDWYLVFSWLFIVLCCLYYGSRTSVAQRLIEWIGRAWKEAHEQAVAEEEARGEEKEETAQLRDEPQPQMDENR